MTLSWSGSMSENGLELEGEAQLCPLLLTEAESELSQPATRRRVYPYYVGGGGGGEIRKNKNL